MRRSLLHHLLTSCLVAICATAAVAAAQRTDCGADPKTGAPLPLKAPGLCLSTSGSNALMLRTAADGLLIIAPADPAQAIASWQPDASAALRLEKLESRLIYCPARTLIAATGAPGPACLADFRTLTPGPGAFVGSGNVDATLALGDAGMARCPSSVQILGDVRSPNGGSFDLSAQLSLVAAPRHKAACRPLGGQIDLTYAPATDDDASAAEDDDLHLPAALEARLAALARLDDRQWALMDELLALDDAQWATLTQLLAIPEEELEEAARQQESAAALTTPGSPPSAKPPTIRALINSVTSKVDSVSGRVNSIIDRLPDRSDVRAALSDIDLPKLRQVLDALRDDLGGVLEMLSEIRSGYAAFAGSGGSCGAGSECAAFKAQIRTLFSDLRESALAVQQLGCLHDPNTNVVPIKTDFFETILVDKAPTVALYTLKRVLDQVDGWQTLIPDAVSRVPASLRGYCQGSTLQMTSTVSRCLASVNKPCCALREVTETELRIPRGVIKFAKNLFSRIEEWTSDDKDVCVEAVAGAGGGGGTNVKNPINGIAKMIKNIADSLQDTMDQLIDRRQNCVDEDSDQERDLADCKLIVDYMLEHDQRGKFEELVEIYDTRVDDMECCVASTDVTDARTAEATAVAQHAAGQRAEAFQTLCTAYRKLTNGPPPGGTPDSVIRR